MLARAAPILTVLCVACLLPTSLTACGDKPPPVVSADTSCDRFAHISFDDRQIEAVKGNWDLWESAVDQIVAHNVEYDKRCK